MVVCKCESYTRTRCLYIDVYLYMYLLRAFYITGLVPDILQASPSRCKRVAILKSVKCAWPAMMMLSSNEIEKKKWNKLIKQLWKNILILSCNTCLLFSDVRDFHLLWFFTDIIRHEKCNRNDSTIKPDILKSPPSAMISLFSIIKNFPSPPGFSFIVPLSTAKSGAINRKKPLTTHTQSGIKDFNFIYSNLMSISSISMFISGLRRSNNKNGRAIILHIFHLLKLLVRLWGHSKDKWMRAGIQLAPHKLYLDAFNEKIWRMVFSCHTFAFIQILWVMRLMRIWNGFLWWTESRGVERILSLPISSKSMLSGLISLCELKIKNI